MRMIYSHISSTLLMELTEAFQEKILSFLMVCRVATFLLYRKVLTHVRPAFKYLVFDTAVHGKPV